MKNSNSRIIGATLLITGCCIGAGMLGLPVVSSLAGFIPSTLTFSIIWLYMMVTGLLVLEVNLSFREEVSFVSMAERTLGTVGKGIATLLFLFLFYSLMVAYITGCSALFGEFFKVPTWVGGLLSVVALGVVLYLGTGAVDYINRLFMVGLILSYFLLIGIGFPHMDFHLLEYQDWSLFYVAVPVMVISFGYHNLIPSITDYLQHNKRKICFSIVTGSIISLLVYILWDGLILGLIPGGLNETFVQGDLATHALRNTTHNPWVGQVAEYFAFFALITSFLGVALSIIDFLADGLHTHNQRFMLTLLAIIPPYLFALLYPKVFFTALNYAGGFATVILFGVLPALMVWKGRYVNKTISSPILPGGKPVLIIIILMSCVIVISQIIQEVVL